MALSPGVVTVTYSSQGIVSVLQSISECQREPSVCVDPEIRRLKVILPSDSSAGRKTFLRIRDHHWLHLDEVFAVGT